MKTKIFSFLTLLCLIAVAFSSCWNEPNSDEEKTAEPVSEEFETQSGKTAHWSFENGKLIVSKYTPESILDGTGAEMPNYLLTDNSMFRLPSAPWATHKNFNFETDITEIVVSGFWRYIGMHAFQGCKGAKTLELSIGLEEIGERSFSDCSALESLTLSKELKKIRSYAFYNCKSIRSITFNENLRFIGENAFSYCESLTSLEFLESLQTLMDAAFASCNGLTKLDIPVSATDIRRNAFASCKKISEVHVHWQIPPQSITDAFGTGDAFCDKATLYVPAGTKSLYQARKPWSMFKKIVEK
ncbi:MAG: leucine-rich repeat domain-containing protein [Cytophagaceae bacterium]|jgi:hypothetical protein|nr:leucine-rich repeat domain-containing protein [Cytophagaceae bacterium]